ncbi:MAG: hypothetical protein HN341_08435 [Verrucomicrobia bacterium]|jgi:hypothetical protein|nr:hypothetical protein [Verrucomicrobiota bacterium]
MNCYEQISPPKPPDLPEEANMGFDPEMAIIGAEMAALYAKGGIKTFKQFSARVKSDMGESWDLIKKYLHGMWSSAAAEYPDIDEVTRVEANEIIDSLDDQAPEDQKEYWVKEEQMKPIEMDEWWDRLAWLKENDPVKLQALQLTGELRSHLDLSTKLALNLEQDALMIGADPVEVRLAATPVLEPDDDPGSQGDMFAESVEEAAVHGESSIGETPPPDYDDDPSWDEIEPAAQQAFNVWVDQPEICWAKTAWTVLGKAGLTDYDTEIEHHLVMCRFLVLAAIYHDFCQAAWDETSSLDYSCWAELLPVSEFVVGQLHSQLPDWDEQDVEVSDALEALAESERTEVVSSLVNGLHGEIRLYESLWQSRAASASDDDDDTDDPWDVTDVACNSGYAWVDQGCPRLG